LEFDTRENNKDSLLRFLKQEDGYDPDEEHIAISQDKPNHVTITVGIADLDCERLEDLKKEIQRKGGSRPDPYKRWTRAELRRKRILNNAFLFLSTYFSGFVGIPVLTSAFGINPAFITTALTSLFPATVALFIKWEVDSRGK
jgi:hypothetical protein